MTRKEITSRIKKLKKGNSFTVTTRSERTMATTEGGAMKRFGIIDFDVRTFAQRDGTFAVIAV